MTAPVECAADCGYPLDPVLVAQGWAMHPGCEYPDTTRRQRSPSQPKRATPRKRAPRKPKEPT